jgi:type IV secretory pathway VirB2 component (pilin)
MKTRILLIAAALFFLPLCASATSTGGALPFTQSLQKIYAELTGPIANVLVGIIFMASCVALAVEHDRRVLKTLGLTGLVVTLIAKLDTVLTFLGLNAASFEGVDRPALLPALALLVAALGASIAWALRESRSSSEEA